MKQTLFMVLVAASGLAFAVAFAVIVLPPALASGDVIGAFSAGFVNPYATGYSLDAILCGFILIVWVLHERKTLGIPHGWVAILLCFIPGVAVAFAYYLILRTRRLGSA